MRRWCSNPRCGSQCAEHEAICLVCGSAVAEMVSSPRSAPALSGGGELGDALSQLEEYCREVMRDGVVSDAEAEELTLWRERVGVNAWERTLERHGISVRGLQARLAAPVLHFRRPSQVIRAGEGWSVHFRLTPHERSPQVQLDVWVDAGGKKVERQRVPAVSALHAPGGIAVGFQGLAAGQHVVRVQVEEFVAGRSALWAGWFDLVVDSQSGGPTKIVVKGNNNTVAGGGSIAGMGNLNTGDPRTVGSAPSIGDWRLCELTNAVPPPKVKRGEMPKGDPHTAAALTVRRASVPVTTGRLLLGSEIVIGRSVDSHVDLRLIAPPGPGDQELHVALRTVSNRALVLDASSLSSGLGIRVDNRAGASIAGAHFAQGSTEFVQLAPDRSTTVELGTSGRVRVDLRGLPRRTLLRDVDRFELGPESKVALAARKAKLGGVRVGVAVDGRRHDYVWLLGTLAGEDVGFLDPHVQTATALAGGCAWLVECPARVVGATGETGLRSWPLMPGVVIELGSGRSFRLASGIDLE